MLQLSTVDADRIRKKPGIFRGLIRWVRWRLPSGISTHRILSGPLRGWKIVTSWRDYPAAIAGITEPQLLGWFSSQVKPGETWLDIGAHYGYTSIALGRLVGSAGRVFAFEPMTATAGCLARTRALNQLDCVTVLPMALGAETGLRLVELNTVRGMVDSTIPADGTPTGAAQWKEIFLVSQLDWLWPRISNERATIHGIKIDVQGMELHVLRGMQEVLRAQRPKLVVELHRGVDRAAVLSLLTDLGYSPGATPIEPVPGETEAQFLDDRSYAFLPNNPL
jgi:FkbM family methyltransferase